MAFPGMRKTPPGAGWPRAAAKAVWPGAQTPKRQTPKRRKPQAGRARKPFSGPSAAFQCVTAFFHAP